LLPAAREELARQIDAGKPDAEKLSRTGFGWIIALQICRQMAEGGNVSMLLAHGFSLPVAMAIARACEECSQRREAARVASARPGPNLGRSVPRRYSYSKVLWG
jgi:hypothetical protein